jgi:hypothetical protein
VLCAIVRVLEALPILDDADVSVGAFVEHMNGFEYPDDAAGIFPKDCQLINRFFGVGALDKKFHLNRQALAAQGAIKFDEEFHGGLLNDYRATQSVPGDNAIFGSSEESISEEEKPATSAEVRSRARDVLHLVHKRQLTRAPQCLQDGWQLMDRDGYGPGYMPGEDKALQLLTLLEKKSGCEGVQFADVSCSLRVAISLERYGIEAADALAQVA